MCVVVCTDVMACGLSKHLCMCSNQRQSPEWNRGVVSQAWTTLICTVFIYMCSSLCLWVCAREPVQLGTLNLHAMGKCYIMSKKFHISHLFTHANIQYEEISCYAEKTEILLIVETRFCSVQLSAQYIWHMTLLPNNQYTKVCSCDEVE